MAIEYRYSNALQRKTLDFLADKFGIRHFDDWYSQATYFSLDVRTNSSTCILPTTSITMHALPWTTSTCLTSIGRNENEIVTLLRKFHSNSLSLALFSLYPEHKWKLWRFGRVPRGFWQKSQHRTEFFDGLAIELGLKTWEDWYPVRIVDIERSGGSGLLKSFYGGSLYRALRSVYPEHPWKFWKFGHCSEKKFNRDSVRLDGIFQCQKLQQKQKQQMEQQRERQRLLRARKRRHRTALMERMCFACAHRNRAGSRNGNGSEAVVISVGNHFSSERCTGGEYCTASRMGIHRNTFGRVMYGYWKASGSIERYLQWLAAYLSLGTLSEWLERVPTRLLHSTLGGSRALALVGGIRNLFHYPLENHLSIGHSGSAVRSKYQLHVYHCVQLLLGEALLCYKHPQMRFPRTGIPMELDVFVPSLSLALEYQGNAHYQWHFTFGSPTRHQVRDEEKRQECSKLGLTLVEIPYWWSGNRDILVSCLLAHRPDLQLLIPIGTGDIKLDPTVYYNALLEPEKSRQRALLSSSASTLSLAKKFPLIL